LTFGQLISGIDITLKLCEKTLLRRKNPNPSLLQNYPFPLFVHRFLTENQYNFNKNPLFFVELCPFGSFNEVARVLLINMEK